jgi:hypothetical protein
MLPALLSFERLMAIPVVCPDEMRQTPFGTQQESGEWRSEMFSKAHWLS